MGDDEADDFTAAQPSLASKDTDEDLLNVCATIHYYSPVQANIVFTDILGSFDFLGLYRKCFT